MRIPRPLPASCVPLLFQQWRGQWMNRRQVPATFKRVLSSLCSVPSSLSGSLSPSTPVLRLQPAGHNFGWGYPPASSSPCPSISDISEVQVSSRHLLSSPKQASTHTRPDHRFCIPSKSILRALAAERLAHETGTLKNDAKQYAPASFTSNPRAKQPPLLKFLQRTQPSTTTCRVRTGSSCGS